MEQDLKNKKKQSFRKLDRAAQYRLRIRPTFLVTEPNPGAIQGWHYAVSLRRPQGHHTHLATLGSG